MQEPVSSAPPPPDKFEIPAQVQTPAPTPAPASVFTPTPSNEPPLRAEPVIGPEPKTELDIAAWQVQLERNHFSCGTIDGDFGMRSKRAITQFQKNRALPVTGILDIETRMAIGMPGNPFSDYTITDADMAMIQPAPPLWRDKAKAAYLGYNDAWEMLSEKFHCSPQFIHQLNPALKDVTAGVTLTAPNLEPNLPLPKAAKIVIILSETTLLAYDKTGKVVLCFPCSIAADKNKRPNGQLTVVTGALNPNYTFNPDVLKEAAAKEAITTKMIIPPGPRNPVGLAWITLSLPGYGIHGTPEPMNISRTGSHGCFRLANWNAVKLYKIVSHGVPVEVVEQSSSPTTAPTIPTVSGQQ